MYTKYWGQAFWNQLMRNAFVMNWVCVESLLSVRNHCRWFTKV